MRKNFAGFSPFVFALCLLGCATQPEQASTPAQSGPPTYTPAPAREAVELAIMPVWTVPSGMFTVGATGYIEVRLTPQQDLPNAVLSATSFDASLVIEAPDRLSLQGLRKFTDAPQTQPRRPNELPAHGLSIIKSFKAVAKAPGHFRVRIELVDGSRMQVRDIFIDAQ